jgi:hypothetical protein
MFFNIKYASNLTTLILSISRPYKRTRNGGASKSFTYDTTPQLPCTRVDISNPSVSSTSHLSRTLSQVKMHSRQFGRFNFLTSTPDAAGSRSRHPLHSTGTVRRAQMDQTLSPHNPSSPWRVHRKHLERTTAPLEARPSYCIQARNACACSCFRTVH